MRFIDEATIKVFGGHGGPGCVSFRRETFEPRGGPDGGDGGAGADVVFVADEQLGTLQDFRFRREYRAPAGEHGSSTNKAGRDGQNIQIRVPVGTIIKDTQTGEVLIEFLDDGQEWVAAEGGRGGKGNAHFVSSTFQAPKFAQPGEDGTSRELTLELKLLADVAIIGFPNAGKSTLISRISAARPKIADYAFTTLTPNLGVVQQGTREPFVVADIPGLIEGAHKGMGLGHKFLKHIERTRLFLHLLDGTKFLEDATADREDSFDHAVEELVRRYIAIRTELGLFNEKLLHKPEYVVVNKVDLIEADPALVERARKALRDRIHSIRGTHPEAGEPFFISGVTGNGLETLVNTVYVQIEEQKAAEAAKRSNRPAVRLPDDEDIRSK
jgi:GTPase